MKNIKKTFIFFVLLVCSQSIVFASQAEQNNLLYIIRSLSEKNINYELRPLLSSYGSFSSSIHVHIPAESHEYNGGTFVLAVPLDSAFASEIALVFIESARHGGLRESKNDILVTFLGNEKSMLGDPLFTNVGLKDLISQAYMPENWALVYLDFDEAPGAIKIANGTLNYITPLELLGFFPSLLRTYEIPFVFESRYNELFKMGLIKGCEKLALLWQDEIHAVSLYPDDTQNKNSEKITTEHLARLLLDYEAALILPLENPGQNYFIASFFNRTFFVSEIIAFIFILILAACILIYLLYLSATHRIKLISRIRLFLRRGWVFIILLPGMILIFRGTGFFYGLMHHVFGLTIPETDIWGSLLIICLGVWLLYLFFHLLSFLNFPRKAQFYGISAIIITGIGILASAIIDFTYIATFIWALLFVIIGSRAKNPIVIILSSVLIPLRALGAFININEAGGLPLELFLVPADFRGWVTSFQIAVLCLPVMLLIKRGMIINKTTLKDIFKIKPFVLRIIIQVILISAMVLTLIFFNEEPKDSQQITVINSENNNDIRITFSEMVFQESLIVNLRLESRIQPLLFNLFLKSEDDETLHVFSSPVPMERINNNSIRFILGENPPNPLNLEIVLRDGSGGIFSAQALVLPHDLGN